MSKISHKEFDAYIADKEVINPRVNKQHNYSDKLYNEARRVTQTGRIVKDGPVMQQLPHKDDAVTRKLRKALSEMKRQGFMHRNEDSLYNPAI